MRSIISRKVLTAAAATGILSLSGGFALAANAHHGTDDGYGTTAAGHAQAPRPADVCGEGLDLGGYVAAAVGDLCAPAEGPGGYGAPAEGPDGYGAPAEGPDGYGEEPTHPPTKPPTKPPTHPPTKPPTKPPTHPPTTPPTHPPTKPPTKPPTHPPTTPPTHPPTTPPTKPPTHPPTHPPTTPPTTHPPTTPPATHPPTVPPTKPGEPHLPDTGSDPALWGAAAISAALIVGGTVVRLRGGRVSRRH
ncbi:hypothetical protein [Streptomyces sp. NPDC091278]|uniref:hypothetical protein n=1 Tax=Streptomyces sp. NPDC091278 TaxID=3155301 RepID=UPI00344B5E1F